MSVRTHASWLAAGLSALVVLGTAACRRGASSDASVVVLGFDGMDYGVTQELMARGKMPNFSRLAGSGRFSPLATSTPAQSPVAWSSFITGEDPGTHGIFDFIHRDPDTMLPYLSTSRTEPPGRSLTFERWRLPLAGGRVELLRRGRAFWEVLERHGIETTIVRIPANFPPSGRATRELSGMGTPDILGTYGTFSFYTTNPGAFDDPTPGGGRILPVDVVDHVAVGTLEGPANPYLRESAVVQVPFNAYIDAEEPVVKLVVGEEERILQVGEWSDWVPIVFRLTPWHRLYGAGRFYLKQVRPDFQLYVSPINMDPFAPAMPISRPGDYAARLARETGRYYTQGMPEDTQALSAGVLSTEEFIAQAQIALDESRQQYRVVLDQFEQGLLFYYFGNLDQVSHMLWRAMDAEHPAYDPDTDPVYRAVLENLYVEFDGIVGETLDRLAGRDMLVVMSDHGFAPWRRAFSLNTWLEQNGYLALIDPDERATELLANVDWTRTRAYGLGFNGLYINVRGRERHGIVPPDGREALAKELAAALRKFIDPATGQPAVARAERREDVHATLDHPEIAPDVIIGYTRGTRVSSTSAMGAVPPEVLTDNLEHWSGDHTMDPDAVPGLLLTSRPLRRPASSLQHLAASIMAELGVNVAR